MAKNILMLLLCVYFIISLNTDAYECTYTPQFLDNLLDTGDYEQFADIFKIPNVDLVDPAYRTRDYYAQFYFNGLDLGDILLRPGQLLNPEKLTDLDGNLNITIKTWKVREIPYYISDTAKEADLEEFILKEIQQFNDLINPNIVFRPYQDQDKDFVFIFCGGRGWYTNWGNVGGPQAICVPDYEFPGFISHEFQHVLGVGHESNRNDRNDYLRMKPEKIEEDLIAFFATYSIDSLTNIGPYDYYSSMGIPVNVPRSNETLMEPIQDGIDVTKIGVNGTMTPTDIQRVKTIYPLP